MGFQRVRTERLRKARSRNTRHVAAVIKFHGAKGPFGPFSNFAPYPIELEGSRWPTSEHYFQAQKFTDASDRERVRRAASPMAAARIGRDRRRTIRRDWESVKVGVMGKAVAAKFRQHEQLRKLLLSTDRATIIEHTKRDRYWGDGGDGSGRNMLGQILMDVRALLREESP